jgi:hypothetical protein
VNLVCFRFRANEALVDGHFGQASEGCNT